MRRRIASWAVAVAVTCSAGLAGAQLPPEGPAPADEAVAESLFEAGRALLAEGRADEACPKFEESNRIAPSAGTLLNLGRCHELSGRTASAWAAYKKALGLARSTGQTRHVVAAEQFIADVTPRLSKLRIEVEDPAPDLVVRAGARALGRAALGVPLAIDPGEHVVTASAPGHVTKAQTVRVEPGGHEVALSFPPLVAIAPPGVAPGSTGGIAEARDADADQTRTTLRTAAIVLGAVGVVGVGIGTGFGIATLSDADEARTDPALCPGGRCSPAGEELVASAETKAWVSNVGFAVGGAALATGVALLVWSFVEGSQDSSRSQTSVSARGSRERLRAAAPAARLEPWGGPLGGGFALGGTL